MDKNSIKNVEIRLKLLIDRNKDTIKYIVDDIVKQ